MMKQTLHALGALTIAAALTMLSTACTNDDSLLADEPQASAVKTYTVSIPATMAGDETRAVSIDGTTITRRFDENERVYVYNVTKTGLMDGYLQPTNISADGKSCTLVGELSDYAIEANDELKLMYNQSHSQDVYFHYISPNGSKESLLDGAVATVTVSSYTGGVLTTTTPASFQPVQSMFRFKFVDENNNAITVKTLKVESAGHNIAAAYWPISNNNGSYSIVVTPSSPTSDYLYMAMHIREDETPTDLTFTVFDNNDKEYVGTRTPPTGGFKNGKYYYNTEPIQLTKLDTRIEPTVTWTSVKNGAAVSPNAYNCYKVYGPLKEGSDIECNPAEITISGTSAGYWFFIGGYGGTVHLNNLTATKDDAGYEFIYSNGDLNLDINGSNSITVRNSQCIYVDGTLKLSGNGTLTTTTTSTGRYGIYGSGNYNDNHSDPAVLPAEGYTVTRSDRVNNGDGTYTLTYTVAPVKPTITWTNPSTPVEPSSYQSYYITVDNVNIALSGTSNGYRVSAAYGGTMRLNGLNATYSDTDKYATCIHANGNLNLVINGENTINCKGLEKCVFAGGTLKLSGNGTLTVICDENQLCGIWGTNYQRSNNNYSSTGELSVTDKLAADGYTVTRSARQSNGDGTYTWTYTVAQVNP